FFIVHHRDMVHGIIIHPFRRGKKDRHGGKGKARKLPSLRPHSAPPGPDSNGITGLGVEHENIKGLYPEQGL
ncbi:MAG: hypothetical protein LBL43_03490, partial [Treponema sp.]|nr:hypothetical protein [Treponema sp.]